MSKNLPDPNMSSADPNAVLRSRIGTPPDNSHTHAAPAHTRPRSGKGTRPDPPGMRRYSLYVAQDAATALDRAAQTIQEALGEDVPRHVAVSALLQAGADQVEAVCDRLAEQRAGELSEQLEALQRGQHRGA